MTDPDEHDLKSMLAAWTIAPPNDAARDRMIGMALQPRRTPWHRRVMAEFERCLSDWRYGVVYKSAALAACLVLGLGVGQMLDEPVDVPGVALVTSVGAGS